MGFKRLDLFTDYELRQELRITTDETVSRYIRKLMRERAAARVGECAAEALDYPSRVPRLGDEDIIELCAWATDVVTRDALAGELWKRDIPLPATLTDYLSEKNDTRAIR